VYNIQCQSEIVRGQVLNITWDLVHPPPYDNGGYYIYVVPIDQPKNRINIGYLMFSNKGHYEWAVNVQPGTYYCSMNDLESNTFQVLQKPSDSKKLNSGGRLYICVDIGPASDDDSYYPEDPPTEEYEEYPPSEEDPPSEEEDYNTEDFPNDDSFTD
ncbi:25921_t:CDS:1, partial [Racocetra persica]